MLLTVNYFVDIFDVLNVVITILTNLKLGSGVYICIWEMGSAHLLKKTNVIGQQSIV